MANNDDQEFNKRYMEELQLQMRRMTEDKDFFAKTMGPIMEMQKNLIEGGAMNNLLSDSSSSEDDDDAQYNSSYKELMDEIMSLKDRVKRLERRVLKPKVKSPGSSTDSDSSSAE